MTDLPTLQPCAYRGPPDAAGRYPCAHPQVTAPRGVSAWNCLHCAYVPPPPELAAAAGLPDHAPGGATPPARAGAGACVHLGGVLPGLGCGCTAQVRWCDVFTVCSVGPSPAEHWCQSCDRFEPRD